MVLLSFFFIFAVFVNIILHGSFTVARKTTPSPCECSQEKNIGCRLYLGQFYCVTCKYSESPPGCKIKVCDPKGNSDTCVLRCTSPAGACGNATSGKCVISNRTNPSTVSDFCTCHSNAQSTQSNVVKKIRMFLSPVHGPYDKNCSRYPVDVMDTTIAPSTVSGTPTTLTATAITTKATTSPSTSVMTTTSPREGTSSESTSPSVPASTSSAAPPPTTAAVCTNHSYCPEGFAIIFVVDFQNIDITLPSYADLTSFIVQSSFSCLNTMSAAALPLVPNVTTSAGAWVEQPETLNHSLTSKYYTTGWNKYRLSDTLQHLSNPILPDSLHNKRIFNKGVYLIVIVDWFPNDNKSRSAGKLLHRIQYDYQTFTAIVGVNSSGLIDRYRWTRFLKTVEPMANLLVDTYGELGSSETEKNFSTIFSSCGDQPGSGSGSNGMWQPVFLVPTFACLGSLIPIVLGSVLGGLLVFAFIVLMKRLRAKRMRQKKIEQIRMEFELHGAHHETAEKGHVDWASQHKKRYTEIPSNSLADDWELPRHRLVVYTDTKLGAGAFGSVFKGKILGLAPAWKHYTQTEMPKEKLEDACVAIKSLPEYADEGAKSDFLQEINFMKRLGYCEYLVCLMGCITLDQPLCLLVELCSDGDLLHFLRKFQKNADRPTADAPQLKDLLSYAWQICTGMVFLISKGYIHRDLAARNVLVQDGRRAKIGDFGLCRHVSGDIYTTRGGRLPIKWMAPESLQFYEYTTKSDVWSYGVTLYEIFTLGGVPFSLVQPADMTKHLSEGNRLKQPDECPDAVYDIMSKCWKASPLDRPSFEEIAEDLRKLLAGMTENYGYFEMQEGTIGMPDGESDQPENSENITNEPAEPDDTEDTTISK